MMHGCACLPDDRTPEVLTVIKNLNMGTSVSPLTKEGRLAFIDGLSPVAVEIPRMRIQTASLDGRFI
jgi:hypothetical protein